MIKRILSLFCVIPLIITCNDYVYEVSNKHNRFERNLNQNKLNYQSHEYERIVDRYNREKAKSDQQRKEEIIKILKEEYIKYIGKLKEEERIRKEKREAEEQKKRQIRSRGLSGEVKDVTCYITYYTNINNKLQGGQYDKKGKLLTSHQEKICALPSSVPYGSYLVLDEQVNGSNIFKNVDTGGSIKFLGGDKVKVDIFIPNVSEQYIINNYENKVVKGKIYYK
ncbi:MAG: hypothetical protein E7H33_08905 [Clostridium perfringens]|uniref:hypothetical protein n=1 Tax=Clostridium perfringens TaxID=1502 RepID=UPI00096A7AAF|nr:hypothetical protein [Clostridium perfringens]MDU4051020.1 hypothetical protein [Clostridium perfringens]